MRVCRIRSFDELARYAGDWQRLAGDVPFRSWTWLSHWWRNYGPQRDSTGHQPELAILCVFDHDERLVGIAPWYARFSRIYGHVLRPLGSGEVCSDYLSVLCLPKDAETIAEELAQYLLQSRVHGEGDSLHWDLLHFDSMEAADRPMGHLVENLEVAGCIVNRRPSLSCWRLALPIHWEDYVASLGKNLRRDVRRIERKLLDNGSATLHSIGRLEELTEAMQILVELHQRRRSILGEAGCFASPRFLQFYRDVVPELFRQGLVEFYWLQIEGRPVAAEFQLVGQGILYAYQAGIDPDSMNLEPGKTIYLAILRQAIERGNRAFDFLRGDEPYKARFGAERHPTLNCRIIPRRVIPRLRHNVWLAGKTVQQFVGLQPRSEV